MNDERFLLSITEWNRCYRDWLTNSKLLVRNQIDEFVFPKKNMGVVRCWLILFSLSSSLVLISAVKHMHDLPTEVYKWFVCVSTVRKTNSTSKWSDCRLSETANITHSCRFLWWVISTSLEKKNEWWWGRSVIYNDKMFWWSNSWRLFKQENKYPSYSDAQSWTNIRIIIWNFDAEEILWPIITSLFLLDMHIHTSVDTWRFVDVLMIVVDGIHSYLWQ